MDEKRQYGTYYTKQSPFELRPFIEWAQEARLDSHTILEPFAGANNIVCLLQEAKICSEFACYDVKKKPKHNDKSMPSITRRDTLKSFPQGYHACVTNPPWLARNSARRRGLAFDVPARYDDVYKYALELALANCLYVAFIIPATFLRSGLFRNRLKSFILLEKKNMFTDTDNPVCLALFAPEPGRADVWINDERAGYLDTMEKRHNQMQGMFHPNNRKIKIRFNAPGGVLGLRGVDDTRQASIRFCMGSELEYRSVKHTDRSITRIDIAGANSIITEKMIKDLNKTIDKFRHDTRDIFLAPFKGLREDGRYRRRLDYATARGMISRCMLQE